MRVSAAEAYLEVLLHFVAMTDFAHLIPSVPSDLSFEEAAAYQRRRQYCLSLLAAQVAEDPDYEPDAYHLTLYCAEVTGRMSSQDVMEALRDHYAQLQDGARQWQPSDRLDDPRRGYYQQGEGYAIKLLGAVYDAWRTTCTPVPPPSYGPYLPGQQPAPDTKATSTKAERYALIEKAWNQLRNSGHYPSQGSLGSEEIPSSLGSFEREVLSSYLTREVNTYQARQLLATHGESPQHQFHC
jgi:hypothetical protein